MTKQRKDVEHALREEGITAFDGSDVMVFQDGDYFDVYSLNEKDVEKVADILDCFVSVGIPKHVSTHTTEHGLKYRYH